MRILYHHRTRGAGVERVHIQGIADALTGLGHNVDIMSVSGLEQQATDAAAVAAKGGIWRLIHAVTLRIPEWLFEVAELAYNLVAGVRMARYLRHWKPDFVYERYSLFLWAGVWVARWQGVAIVLEVNDSAVVERVRPLFFVGLAKRIEKWVFQNCNGIVFISGQFQQDVLRRHGKLATSIVSPNGADIRRFSPLLGQRERMRQELGIEDRIVCGYVGAFVFWHGIDWFVREVLDVLPERPDLVLLLVGDGRLFDDIRVLIQSKGAGDQIRLTGRVPHQRVATMISAMDFAILPDSNTYGSPVKLFELMAMGIGVVAPDYGPIREVIDDGQTGWLFPARDHKACIRRVIEVTDAGEQRKRVGQSAREYIVESRQWRHNAEQLLGLVSSTRMQGGRGA